jgi:DNA-binding transcriptional LysR family regulator
MKLHQLDALMALVEAGSIRGAARALSITQPALSARVAELEAELGATLVNRTAHGTTLTPVGHALFSHARVIRNHVHQAERDIAQLLQRGSAKLAVGASPLAEMEIVGPLLQTLQQNEPDLHLTVMEGQFLETSVALREGALDLALAQLPLGKQSAKSFHFEELVTYPMHVVARSGTPYAKARRLNDLVDAKWVVGATTSTEQSTIEELFLEHGLPRPSVAVHADAITMVQASIAASDMLGLLPRPLFHGWPQLVPLAIADRIRPLRLGLITPAASPLTTIAERFAAMARERGSQVAKRLASQRVA